MFQIDDCKEELLIGLISDTHIPYHGPIHQEIFIDKIPEALLEDFKRRQVDYVIHLGDYVEYRVFEELQDVFGKDKVIGIRGNMDNSEVQNKLPETLEFDLFGYKIFALHGEGGPNMIIRRISKHYDISKYDIVICGHIHRPLAEVRDGKWFINPGTPTDTKFTDIHSYAFLRLGKGKIEPEICYL